MTTWRAQRRGPGKPGRTARKISRRRNRPRQCSVQSWRSRISSATWAAWRSANAGHVSLDQLKVMSAIERCRTAASGACRALREALAHRHRLQLLSQPPLPEMPGRGGAGMAGRARGRAAAGPILSRSIHPAGPDRRHRLSEQGRDLRPAVQGIVRDHAHHCSRSEASRRSDRHLVCPAHLGLSTDPPPACAYDRARRRVLARWKELGLLPAAVLAGSGRAVRIVPRIVPHKLRAAYRAGELQFFGKHTRLIDPRAFAAYLAPLWNKKWVVYCKRPFGGPKDSCAISPATLIASPSQIAA